MNSNKWADVQFKKQIRNECKKNDLCVNCQFFIDKQCRVQDFVKKNTRRKKEGK